VAPGRHNTRSTRLHGVQANGGSRPPLSRRTTRTAPMQARSKSRRRSPCRPPWPAATRAP